MNRLDYQGRQSIWLTLFANHFSKSNPVYFQQAAHSRTQQLFEGVSATSYKAEDFLISHITVQKEIRVPEHHHAYRQMGLVLQGVLEMCIDGRLAVLGEGDFFAIPSNVSHSARTMDVEAVLVEAYYPLTEELMAGRGC